MAGDCSHASLVACDATTGGLPIQRCGQCGMFLVFVSSAKRCSAVDPIVFASTHLEDARAAVAAINVGGWHA